MTVDARPMPESRRPAGQGRAACRPGATAALVGFATRRCRLVAVAINRTPVLAIRHAVAIAVAIHAVGHTIAIPIALALAMTRAAIAVRIIVNDAAGQQAGDNDEHQYGCFLHDHSSGKVRPGRNIPAGCGQTLSL